MSLIYWIKKYTARKISQYIFSAVFAPTALNTKIMHKWQYYDKYEGVWVTVSEIPFSIVGGRDGGYRGYSFKKNLFPGRWRVDVITEREQLLGRIYFKVIDVKDAPTLKVEIK